MSIYTQGSPVMNNGAPRRTSAAYAQGPSPPIVPGLLNNGENNNVDPHPLADNNSTVPGWPELAKSMALKSDLQAFSSFTDLNIKSLLYYQAELIHLRKQLHKVEFKDYRQSNTNDPAADYAKDLEVLFRMVGDPDKKTPEKWTIMCKIREVLDKYNNALLQFSQMSAFGDADSANVRSLRDCVGRVGADGKNLTGDGSKVWGNPLNYDVGKQTLQRLILNVFTGLFISQDVAPRVCENEFSERLIVPRPRREPDGLTLWMVHSFIPLYNRLCTIYNHQLRGRPPSSLHSDRNRMDEENKGSESVTNDAIRSTSTATAISPSLDVRNLTEYSAVWIIRLTSIVTTVLLCLLPAIAIIILARVHTIGMTLGLIALFTALFALGLVLMSEGSSRMQIFTATAIFPAFMVAFVQNQLTPGGQGIQV